MSNTAQNPWAPDPDNKPGVLGEHGSSAFAGNANFAAYDNTKPNDGAGRAARGANDFGDAPTAYSDDSATPFVFRARVDNQVAADARRTQRNS